MQAVRRVAAVLIYPLITCLGAACERAGPPTQAMKPPPGAAFNLSSPSGSPQAVPFVFVGTAAECGGTAGSRIVTSAWLGGMGLPDNGGANNPNLMTPADAPNKGDPHDGLLLSKNGRSEICSASGARITGVRGVALNGTDDLGFDYRNGGHCGAGAPRFNVVVKDPVTNTESFHFVGGCGNDVVPATAPQDPLEWTQVRFSTSNPAHTNGDPITPGSKIVSISIFFDEGTENAGLEDPRGVGLAVVDNIFIAGQFIREGSGIATGPEPKDDDFDHDGIKNDVDPDDDNDGIADGMDTDADGDGVEDVLQLNLTLPTLRFLQR